MRLHRLQHIFGNGVFWGIARLTTSLRLDSQLVLQQGGQTCIHYDQAGHKHCQTLISDTIDSLLAGGDQLTDVSACNLAGGQHRWKMPRHDSTGSPEHPSYSFPHSQA